MTHSGHTSVLLWLPFSHFWGEREGRAVVGAKVTQ